MGVGAAAAVKSPLGKLALSQPRKRTERPPVAQFEPGSAPRRRPPPARAMKIYTRTGDAGSASLYSGERRPKGDAVFAALGDVDELCSALGLAREHALAAASPDAELCAQLEEVQSRLLDAGSAVATPLATASAAKRARAAFDAGAAAELERWIDAADAGLPPLAAFILPSGGLAAAQLHVARAVCRRAERAVVPLAAAGACERAVAVYLNRLSDWLFTAARVAAARAGRPEVVYKKKAAAAAAPEAAAE